MRMDIKVKPHRALGGQAHLWTVGDITDAEIRYSNSSPLKLRPEVFHAEVRYRKRNSRREQAFVGATPGNIAEVVRSSARDGCSDSVGSELRHRRQNLLHIRGPR